MTRDRQQAIGRGLISLAKAAILAFGVPLALVRLWMLLNSVPTDNSWNTNEMWIRAIIVIVALLWAKALASLVMDIRGAIRGTHQPSGSWSVRWAVAIAGLALLLSVWHAAPQGHSPIAGSNVALVSPLRPDISQTQPARSAVPANPRRAECLSEVALRTLGETELWSVLAAHNMDREITPGERFVDASLLRGNWCLPVQLPHSDSMIATVTPVASHESKTLEELEWLGLGILGTAAFVRRLNTLRTAARTSRDLGERLEHRDAELEALEARLEPFGQAVLLDWIEVANRLLRHTAGLLRISPQVALVRAGPTGVTFYFSSSLRNEAAPFVASADGTAWTLPLNSSLASMQSRVAEFGRLIPALIPVGDDGEHCYLVAVAPGQSLTIDAPPHVAQEIVRGITTGLRTLPWAEELHVEMMDLAPPPATEHCYQMADSSAAALAELASNPPPRRHPTSSPTWRREPLIITTAFVDEGLLMPAVVAVAGVVQLGESGTARLHVEETGARLEPYGIELRVPRANAVSSDLIERLFARATSVPALTPLAGELSATRPRGNAEDLGTQPVMLTLFNTPPDAKGLLGEISGHDRARIIEVLAYLVLHDGSCSVEELGNALFPRAGKATARRVEDALAATRRALGASIALTVSMTQIRLGHGVGADWTELVQCLAAARVGSVSEAQALLNKILQSPLLQPLAPFRWMNTEGLSARLCFELCDGLHHLFALTLAEGSLDLAARAVARGLQLEPTSELLVRDLMILRSQQDDSNGVTESYEQLEAALVEIGGREPSWTTRGLFEQLAGNVG
jgi:DNA-binding SARP family transcriptional activator